MFETVIHAPNPSSGRTHASSIRRFARTSGKARKDRGEIDDP